MNLRADFIKKRSMENGIDFIGIASPDRFTGAPAGYHPADLMKTVQSVIVCGTKVPRGALIVPGTLYHNTVELIQIQLEQAAMKLIKTIEENGGMACLVPAHGPFHYWDEEHQTARGDLSHKHAAVAAGLGKIGKSSVFISRRYGALTRLVSILTDIKLDADPLTDWEPCQEGCTMCMDACPVNAIKPQNQGCDQKLCRTNIFKETMRGVKYEDCRECLKACPWVFGEQSGTFNLQNVNNQENAHMIIGTLGPTGTCSEYASQFYINTRKYNAKIDLYSTFEDSITALKAKKADIVIIPSAYQNFARIIFKEEAEIELTDVFKLVTPNLVIAKKRGSRRTIPEIKKIATHPSPSSMVQNYLPGIEMVITRSNSESADYLLQDKVDACLTTVVCARNNALDIIHDFGNIPMGWNVVRRKNR